MRPPGVAGVACHGRGSVQCWRPGGAVLEECQPRCIRETEITEGPYRESEGFIVPFEIPGQHNPYRGKGPCFVHATEEWRMRGLP